MIYAFGMKRAAKIEDFLAFRVAPTYPRIIQGCVRLGGKSQPGKVRFPDRDLPLAPQSLRYKSRAPLSLEPSHIGGNQNNHDTNLLSQALPFTLSSRLFSALIRVRIARMWAQKPEQTGSKDVVRSHREIGSKEKSDAGVEKRERNAGPRGMMESSPTGSLSSRTPRAHVASYVLVKRANANHANDLPCVSIARARILLH